MPQTNSTLTFETENQSLWGPGEALTISFDTGDTLVYDPAEITYDFDVGLLGNGVEGQFYLDFKIGLIAYASLPSAGSFDATFNFDIGVEVPGAVDVTQTSAFTFDVVSFNTVSASIESSGFSNGAEAGLDLVLGIEAGARDLSYYTWFKDGDLDDASFISVDERLSLINVSTASPEFEVELTQGVTLTGRLPTGADTEGTSTGSLRVEAEGASDTRFIELNADLDELLVRFGSKIPGVGAVIKALGETVFAEHVFDIADYVPFLPEGKIELSATLLDIGAGLGAVITEDVALDVSGSQNAALPDIAIALRSDNGTPLDMSDDTTTTTTLATLLSGNNVAALAAPTSGTGTATITATYDLESARFEHAMGVGLNASITIEALSASLQGAWVPSALAFSFGPLFEAEFPDGGLQLDLFDFFEDDFELADDAFDPVSDTYTVFYTDTVPPSLDINAPGIEQAVYRYREALSENLAAAQETFDFLWADNPGQDVALITAGHNNPGWSGSGVTRIWAGNVDATLSISGVEDPENYVAIRPVNPATTGVPLSNLRVNLASTFTSSPNTANQVLTDALEADDPVADRLAILDALGTSAGRYLIYEYGDGSAERRFSTTNAVEIEGNNRSDVLVYYPGFNNNTGATFFDGGDEFFGTGDVFIADFGSTDPDTAIVWDLPAAYEARFDNDASTDPFVELANGVIVGSIESVALRTGNADDDIVLHFGNDYVDTAGGDDIVTVSNDFQSDEVRLGAGDDVAIVGSLTGSPPTSGVDRVFGGTGRDRALHNHTDFTNGLRVDFDGTFANGVGANATISELAQLLSAQINALGSATLAQLTALDSGATGIELTYLRGGSTLDRVVYDLSVEHVSVMGTDLANDVVLFNGGFSYVGGDGAQSDMDVLVGDFLAYEQLLGVTGGLNIEANGGTFTFGDSVISGFERIYVRGTSTADLINGGEFSDYITGNAGNDRIDGGFDKVQDFLFGGTGSDTITWFNAGNDLILADGNLPDDGIDTLIIGTDFTDTRGLQYATSSTGLFNAQSSLADLLNAMDLIGSSGTPTPGLVGVTFDTPAGYSGTGTAGLMNFGGFERVNVDGSIDHDDLIIYQGGASYDGREAVGDADVFVADFTGGRIGIDLVLEDENTGPTILANGVAIAGMDRAIVRGTDGADTFRGASLDDWFDGGLGRDTLIVSSGNDTLRGGADEDTFFWIDTSATATRDVLDGGADEDVAVLGMANESMGILTDTPALGTASTFGLTSEQNRMSVTNVITMTLAQATNVEIGTDANRAVISDIEVVNVAGSDAHDDVIVMMGGEAYNGGERADGTDIDIFAADLRGTSEAIDVDLNVSGDTVIDIAGARVVGFENYILRLGSGDDRVIAGEGTDFLDGGDGDDYLESSADALNTSGFADQLVGGAGDDTLVSTGVEAALIGGDGQDRALFDFDPFATGAGGSDLVAFIDTIAQGSQFLSATDVDDYAEAGNLYDNLLPSAVSTGYAGGTFARLTDVEELRAALSAEQDTTLAGILMGLADDSQLIGASGDDTLISWTGDDILVGDAGLDTYVFGLNGGNDVIAGESVGGGHLVFHGSALADLSVLNSGNDLLVLHAGGSVTVRDYFADDAGSGGTGFGFTVETSDFNGALDVSAISAPGNGPALGQTVYGTAEADGGTQGSDGAGANGAFTGTAGRDIIRGGRGDDYMLASAGGDVFDGGAGENWVSYSETSAGVNANLTTGRGSGGLAQGDTYIAITGLVGAENGANTLTGDRHANSLIGGNAADTIRGEAGDDFILGSEGNDDLFGGDGDDIVFGDEGDDTVRGEAGDDVIGGGTGDDTVEGGDGNDHLYGSQGDDDLFGGTGEDVLYYGGDDDETTAIDENGVDSFDGGFDVVNDTLDLSAFEHAVWFEINASAGPNVRTSDGESVQRFVGADRLIATTIRIERFIATDFDDIATDDLGLLYELGAGDDLVEIVNGNFGGVYFGGTGFDSVTSFKNPPTGFAIDLTAANAFFGTTGTFTDNGGSVSYIAEFEEFIGSLYDDTFVGDDVANIFQDRQGSDTFDGGGGEDILIAGVSLNRFDDSYTGGNGFDTIDYSAATTDIEINLHIEQAFDLSAVAIGTDAVIGFEHAIAGSGNDFLIGSFGDDTLEGGDGNDFVRGLEGDDILVGGRGNDTLDGDVSSIPSRANVGFDIADYSFVVEQLVVDLSLASGQVVATGAVNWTDTLFSIEAVAGGTLDDQLLGSSGDDILMYANRAGEGGFDIIDGRGGNDIADFSGFGAAIRVDLDAAIEVTTNDLGHAGAAGAFRDAADLRNIETIIFTDYGDLLLGTSGADERATGFGDDVLVGHAGADVFDGQGGSDTADYSQETGTFSDANAAGVVVDMTGGLLGTSTIRNAFLARDTHGDIDTLIRVENVIGTARRDVLIGDERNNLLSGEGGDDDLFGMAGTNVLDGGAGEDELFGGTGTDHLFGGDDADLLIGGAGDDAVDGGAGDDTIVSGDGADAMVGGDGTDTVTYAGAAAGIALSLATGGTAGEAEGDTFETIEVVVGTDFDDAIDGDEGANTLDGGDGKDVLRGLTGDDVLVAGFDDGTGDVFDGGVGSDTYRIDGSAVEGFAFDVNLENDSDTYGNQLISIENVTGGTKADILRGALGDEANELRGMGGNDILFGGGGADLLEGGDGNDRLEGGTGGDALDGGAGFDTAFYGNALESSPSVGVIVNLVNSGANAGEAAGDTLAGIERVVGSAFRDALIGDGNVNVLEGGDSNDFLTGLGGDDALVGGNGGDRLDGGLGADDLNGGDGFDNAFYRNATTGAVTVDLAAGTGAGGEAQGDTYTSIELTTGSFFSDVLLGDGDRNGLSGSGGNDVLNGRGGNDSLFGSVGNDTFVFQAGHGVDRILDFTDGQDTLDYSTHTGVTNFADLTVFDTGTGNTIVQDGAGGQVVLIGAAGTVDASDFTF